MVQITVDTKLDSPATLRRVIQLLEHELQERGEQQPFKPLTVETETPSVPDPTPSAFDMFNSSSESSFENPLAGTFDTPTESPSTNVLEEPLGRTTLSANDLLKDDSDEDDKPPSTSVHLEPY